MADVPAVNLRPDPREATTAGEPPAGDVAAWAHAYRCETARLIRSRLELALGIYLLFVGVVVAVERSTPGNAGTTIAYASEVLICVAAIAAGRTPRFADAARAIAVVCMSSLAVAMLVYSAAIGNPWDPVAIGQVCLMTCVSILVPWGWRAQLTLVVVSCGGFLLSIPFLQRTTATVYPVVALLTSGVTSVWAASLLDRFRRHSFMQAAQLRHASDLQREEAETSTALLHVNEMLGQHVGHGDLFDRVNQMVVDALGTDWSTSFAEDERTGTSRFVGSVGVRPEAREDLEGIDLSPDAMPIYEQLRQGRVVEIADPDRQDLVPPELLERWHVSSLLEAPIFRNGKLVGRVATGYSTRRGPFSRKQRRLLLGIANALAMGTDNDRLIRDLREANRLKSDFVSTMSHELRTPLNVILGYAEILADEPQEPADVRLFAERIDRNGRELLELIDATLDLGRLELGRDELRLGPIPFAALLADVGAQVDALARARGLQIHWNDRLGATTIVTDATKLKTILKNLIGNAFKYTPAGSVTVSAERDGDDLLLGVSDTGIGIAPKDVQAIFEMFRRIDGDATRAVGGVGLGLYIVRQLVERLGGTIAVDSAPGAGSTFVVRVPMRLHDVAVAQRGDALASPERR